MDLKKVKGKYYFERLATDYDNLKKSKDEEQYKFLMHLIYSYGDTIFALGRTDADEFIQAIILCSDPESFDE